MMKPRPPARPPPPRGYPIKSKTFICWIIVDHHHCRKSVPSRVTVLFHLRPLSHFFPRIFLSLPLLSLLFLFLLLLLLTISLILLTISLILLVMLCLWTSTSRVIILSLILGTAQSMLLLAMAWPECAAPQKTTMITTITTTTKAALVPRLHRHVDASLPLVLLPLPAA